MSLPIRAFWLMNHSVGRLMAEKDMRALGVAINAQGGESLQTYRDNLTIEMGEFIKLDPVASATRDEEGFRALKAMCK